LGKNACGSGYDFDLMVSHVHQMVSPLHAYDLIYSRGIRASTCRALGSEAVPWARGRTPNCTMAKW
jgi:hypothetical protein